MDEPVGTSTAPRARCCHRVLIVEVVIVLVAGAITGLLRLHPWDRGPNVLRYGIELADSRAGVAGIGDTGCEGKGAYSFLHGNAPVMILEVGARDHVLASGTLTSGTLAKPPTENGFLACDFTFSVEVPYAEQYLVVVGADDEHAGYPMVHIYSRQELRELEWRVGVLTGAWPIRGNDDRVPTKGSGA